jgi:hypothetical protein
MSKSDITPVNFRISAAAARAMERVRREHDIQFPDDPAAVLSVGWGTYIAHSAKQFEGVVIGVYTRSSFPDVAHGVQEASGVKFIYFATEDVGRHFAGKILDHTDDRGFFLRASD